MNPIKYFIVAISLALTVSIIVANSRSKSGSIHEPEASSGANIPIDDKTPKPRNVAIVLYNGVELLDFAGPGEVFTQAETANGETAFNLYTVAASTVPIVSQGFVTITPQYAFENAPRPDIVVFPGGDPDRFLNDKDSIAWAKKAAAAAEIAVSVCNGARILGRTGSLDNKKVTTHWGTIERLRKEIPTATVLENTRFVDSGQVVTTAGVSAGIDGSLHIVERLLGHEAALKAARGMEYDWRP